MYDLAETQFQLQETQSKLSDATETLGELQNTFRDVIGVKGLSNDGDARTASPSSPCSPLPQTQAPTIRTYAESLQPLAAFHPPPSSSRRRVQLSRPPGGRLINRSYIETARVSIPGYYSENSSEAVCSTIDAALTRLFIKARAGNEYSTALVKALCREAHGTPPERKTYGQKYILSQWRNPSNLPHGLHLSNNPSHLINPQHNDPPEAWIAYYTQYPKSLPKGVRVNPETGAPIFGDIVASRLLARLRPNISQLRAEFNIVMINLFTQRGQYRRMIRENLVNIPQAAVNYQPFEPGCREEAEGPIAVLDVARHYSNCGVSIEVVESYVESWAEEYAKKKFEL
ncbi:hypothetical protein GGU11DRAFT_467298 [Lentinula aff. detonsa]|nr:hypothetical protein GGU11DRAFT_467298 [Lentinula aff. detonsa]